MKRDRVAEFILVRKVARRLAAIRRADEAADDPRRLRGTDESWAPTVFDYYRLDPMFRSTMTGAFAGRIACAPKVKIS